MFVISKARAYVSAPITNSQGAVIRKTSPPPPEGEKRSPADSGICVSTNEGGAYKQEEVLIDVSAWVTVEEGWELRPKDGWQESKGGIKGGGRLMLVQGVPFRSVFGSGASLTGSRR